MKKQISNALLGLLAAVVLAAGVRAQTVNAAVRINVPFDFVVGQKQMPAGKYTVRRVKSDAEQALVIQREDGRAAALVLTTTGDAGPRSASLAFRQVGERYFLAAVSMPGTASVRELPKSGVERRLERELAGQGKPGESKTVTVAGSVQ